MGSTPFSDEVLTGLLRARPNRVIFGIRGLTWWLWMYRLGERIPRGIGRALMQSGEAPAWLDTGAIADDVDQLKRFFTQEGFRSADVRAHIDTTRSGRRALVTFHIDLGKPTFLREVRYEGVQMADSVLRTSLVGGSALMARPLRYSESDLVSERRRLVSALRDAGFATVTRDSIMAVVTSLSPDSMDVVIRVRPGPRYRFGAVHFDVQAPLGRPTASGTSTHGGDSLISYNMAPGIRLAPDLLRRALRMPPGAPYSQSGLQATKQRLEATGVFTYTDITPEPTHDGVLPHRITLRTRPRHQFEGQTFLVQSSGVLGGVGSALGAGLGVSYENVNLFGRGEVLRFSSTGSIAADIDSTLLSSIRGEVTASLVLPYLVAPLRDLESRLNLYRARTRFTLSLTAARRDDLRLLLRGRGGLRTRLEMRHTRTVTSMVDLLDLTVSDPDTLPGFRALFLKRILGTDSSVIVVDPVQRARVLQDYTRPLVNSAFRYTYRSASVNPLRRDSGYSYEAAMEVGGNLPYLLDRHVLTPHQVEGSLPGLPFFRRSGSTDRMNYHQYVRVVADVRRYLALGPSSVLAIKAVGGWAHPTGRSDRVPFYRRFFSGGASSVRGWPLRALGPGATSFARAGADDDPTYVLGGDIKLEFSVEVRQAVIRHALGAEWIAAAFSDAGNVWFGPRNPGFAVRVPGSPTGHFATSTFVREMGVGTGMGLRLAWPFLVARLDLAYRAWDPTKPDSGWWPDGLRSPVAYFRFGHAF